MGISGVYTRLQKARHAQKEMPAEQHGASSKQESDAGDLQALIEDAAMADLWTDRNQPLLRAYYAPSKLLSTFPTESPSIFILCR